jgi:hypothetical protein
MGETESPAIYKNVPKNSPGNVPGSVPKNTRSVFIPNSELQNQRIKQSLATYSSEKSPYSKKSKKIKTDSGNTEKYVKKEKSPKIVPKKKAPKGMNSGILDLLGGNESFLNVSTHSGRYDTVEAEEEAGREEERERLLMEHYRNNYGNNDPQNTGGNSENENDSQGTGGNRYPPSRSVLGPDTTYNSDIDDYGAEVWGVRPVVSVDTVRKYGESTYDRAALGILERQQQDYDEGEWEGREREEEGDEEREEQRGLYASDGDYEEKEDMDVEQEVEQDQEEEEEEVPREDLQRTARGWVSNRPAVGTDGGQAGSSRSREVLNTVEYSSLRSSVTERNSMENDVKNEYENKTENMEGTENQNPTLESLERNFWTQDPLLQQQLGLLSDKRDFLEKLNNLNFSTDERRKSAVKEKENRIGKDFSSAPFTTNHSLPPSSTALRENSYQNSLLSARADIHGILAKSVNYHGGELLGKIHGFPFFVYLLFLFYSDFVQPFFIDVLMLNIIAIIFSSQNLTKVNLFFLHRNSS